MAERRMLRPQPSAFWRIWMRLPEQKKNKSLMATLTHRLENETAVIESSAISTSLLSAFRKHPQTSRSKAGSGSRETLSHRLFPTFLAGFPRFPSDPFRTISHRSL
uniref:Uncharacterized protein n=1 Tax=Coccidioides posadasii RMSCC 3488 TaxID=454284 RepID=A0A0J6I4F8_COCPO|nr:hypothetical protein CPAG_02597 [Coccidioides posadasii RMSCC 3488]